MKDTEEISTMEVSEKGLVTSEEAKKSVLLLQRKFNGANNELADLSQLEVDYSAEAKELTKKINELTEKYKARKKELRGLINIIGQKRLVKLGERTAYRTQIIELGGKIKTIDTSKLIEQIK
jgi:hypothetical protein